MYIYTYYYNRYMYLFPNVNILRVLHELMRIEWRGMLAGRVRIPGFSAWRTGTGSGSGRARSRRRGRGARAGRGAADGGRH